MISLPLLQKYKIQVISVIVMLQAVLVAALFYENNADIHTLAVTAAIPLFAFCIEYIGSHTGFPFGSYAYTNVLKPQFLQVPLIVCFAWLMMLPPAWAIAEAILPASALWKKSILAAAAFTAWDFYLDPLMVSWNGWQWKKAGIYMGIPLSNYAGWFFSSMVITMILNHIDIPVKPLLWIYGITWILQAIAHLCFWRLRISGIIGCILMGSCFIIAFLQVY